MCYYFFVYMVYYNTGGFGEYAEENVRLFLKGEKK